MLRLASDADIPKSLVRAIRQVCPEVDLVRVQEVGLRSAADSIILDWAAEENRVVISCDRKTMIAAAYDRLHAGVAMPGLIMPDQKMTHDQVAYEVAMIVQCCSSKELEGQIFFLPM